MISERELAMNLTAVFYLEFWKSFPENISTGRNPMSEYNGRLQKVFFN